MAKPTVKNDTARETRYIHNEQLYLGDHLGAFNTKIESDIFLKREYEQLRYVAVNFAGMLSRLSADMLFGAGEYPRISFKNKKTGEWFDLVSKKNHLPLQMYESALENSFRGDALFRIRSEEGNLIIEDINPLGWFPVYSKGNVRKEVTAHVLQWETAHEKYPLGKDDKLAKITVQEVHKKGSIETIAMVEVKGSKEKRILSDIAMKDIGLIGNVDTGVDDFLIIHVPNMRINSKFFGIDDYADLLPLMFAINNRMTKIDNVLDKHGDPILAVPTGVLDEDGKVSKKAFGVIEYDGMEGGDKPDYIVWDAKLESSFAMIEHLVDYLFMVSETSPAAFGMDKKGQAESGRALKFKMLRTLAKKHRKQGYYDIAMKDMIVIAQKFAKANTLKVGGKLFTGEIEAPQIEWKDGIVNDDTETMDIEVQKLDNEITRRVDSIMRVEGITQEQAEARVKEIDEENEKRAESNLPHFKQPSFANNE